MAVTDRLASRMGRNDEAPNLEMAKALAAYRLVWGAMTALAAISRVDSTLIRARIEDIYRAMEAGSVITVDNGVRTLAGVAASDPEGRGEVIQYLLNHLKTCRLSEMPQHAESTLVAVNAGNRAEFAAVLRERERDMTPARTARVRKIYRALDRLK